MVGEITEISGDLKALSHQLAVFTHRPTVVSHDLLMHQNLDRFLRQPRVKGAASAVAVETAALPLKEHSVEV